jgi:hypothetical protein
MEVVIKNLSEEFVVYIGPLKSLLQTDRYEFDKKNGLS